MRAVAAASPQISSTTPVAAVQGKLVKPASASLWDFCYLDSETLSQIEQLPGSAAIIATADSTITSDTNNNSNEKKRICEDYAMDDLENFPNGSRISSAPIAELQHAISSTEGACRESISVVDDILKILEEVNTAYDDVTGRTNSLMVNCENLLEQQHTYQQTVQVLIATLKPFNDIETVSKQLGIPFDPLNAAGANSSGTLIADTTAIDPRSPEFKEILERLAGAAKFLDSSQEILDKKLYHSWLENLENRAMSLVGRAMRELIEKAAKNCSEMYQTQVYQRTVASNKVKTQSQSSASRGGTQSQAAGAMMIDDKPIESAPVYQKFRGLGYRLRELSSLLVTGSFADSVRAHLISSGRINLGGVNGRGVSDHNRRTTHRTHSSRNVNVSENFAVSDSTLDGAVMDLPVISEVKEGYVNVRNDLLVPFIKDVWAVGLESAGITLTPAHRGQTNMINGRPTFDGTASLCSGIRNAFATLLRVTQLEQQLFNSLFTTADSATNSDATAAQQIARTVSVDGHAADTTSSQSKTEQTEVLSIVQTLSNATRDFLRPYIIHESDVDELCRIVSALSEDVRAQMLSMPVPTLILRQLLRGLDGTVNDAKERLSYCAEMSIRTSVQLFEPLPSQLAYPDILEAYTTHQKAANHGTVAPVDNAHEDMNITDVYQTWYPPMRNALSLLSKLYGVVEMGVFEDFARRAVHLCVQTLRTGSEGVKRSHPGIHGDLFLVRHLLILREQLVPFELRLQGVEKRLDFSTTGSALQQLISNAQSMWRFDESNGFLQLARAGVPRMQETQIDVKRDLDGSLKAACFSLKHSAVKMLLGAMDGFLAKVTAFAGNIPTTLDEAADQSVDDHDKKEQQNSLASNANSVPLLPPAIQTRLKGQAFVRPERMKEMLQSVQTVLLQRVPDLKAMMELYIDNSVARTILLKPILQDFDENKRKMECIIASCLDAGQPRRDVEHLLQTLSMTVISELTSG